MTGNNFYVMFQGLYGNRTMMEISEDMIDRYILGYIGIEINDPERIDRTIVSIPNTNNIVIVYNKKQEETNKKLKPLVDIPESGIKIYSRCLICKIDNNGMFVSLQPEDIDSFIEYLAK